MNNIDNYTIDFDSEENVTGKLNFMAKYQQNLFKLVVMDDDDEKYVPNFDFDYNICDCSKENLLDKRIWNNFIDTEIPIVFINTSDLFKQFENFVFFGHKYSSGAGAFSQIFYFFHRDKQWLSKSKLIFIVSEENALQMYKSVNYGFGILLQPFYMRKDVNKLDGETVYSKVYKK